MRPGSPRDLASDPPNPFAFHEEEALIHGGQLYRFARTAILELPLDGGAVTVLASGIETSTGIEAPVISGGVDDSYLYWIESGGALLRTPN